MFKINQMVVVDKIPIGYKDKYPWREGEVLLYLGVVVQMSEHCIVVNKDGRVFWGYDVDNFREPTRAEL